MARPRPAQPVKLIAGLLGGDPDLLRRTRQLLVRQFGPVDLESELWAFTETDYYADEMGPDLKRCFLSFATLTSPDMLVQIKLDTNALEQEIAEQALDPDIARPINIDPGYIDPARLVLATTKDRAHRVYVGFGIYAEVTLQFRQGVWEPQPWTYPDYRRPEYHAFFTAARDHLLKQRAALPSADSAPDLPAPPSAPP